MRITRTVRAKLLGDDPAIGRTIEAFNSAANYASEVAWERKIFRSPLKLQKVVYRELRNRFRLKSQMACACCRRVIGAHRSMRANGRLKRARFNGSSVELNFPRDFRINRGIISLNTAEGLLCPKGANTERKRIPFLCGAHQRPYLAGGWWIGGARLLRRRTGYFLDITVYKEVEVRPISESATVIGVDLGQRYLAVATTGDRNRFLGGGALKNRKEHYLRVRRGLQEKDTRSARRALKRLSGREGRLQQNANHIVSKRLVEWAAGFPNPVIVMEDLAHLRENAQRKTKKGRRELHTWAFAQLQRFIEYKANALGIPVVFLNPAYTSRTCSRCGHLGIRNRHLFQCSACGYSLHADLNAARNLRHLLCSPRYILGEPGLGGQPPEFRPPTGRDKPPISIGGS